MDSATAYSADDSLTALEGLCVGDRIIRCGLWPRFPNLTSCGFYLWGDLKNRVYRTNHHTEEELKKTYDEKFVRKNFVG
jgi:hypothetical protein